MAIVISDTLYSEENMLRIWNDYWSENNKKYIKKARRDRPTTSKTELGTKNPLYYLIFDEGVPIAYSGIENNGTFYASAGMFVIPEYHRQGLSEKLLDKKLQKSGSKPYITFVNNLSRYWMRFLNRKGLIKADIDNLPDGMPENIVQKEIDAHGEDNVLIYNNSEVVKSWQEILKKKKKGKATATHNSKGEKKDRCARIADRKYKEHGAYKSGAIVRCRQGKIWRDEK